MHHLTRSRLLHFAAAATGLLALASPSLAHIQLLAPNGGEMLQPGTQFTIQWKILVPHGQQDWDIWYSNSGPNGPWIPVAMDLPPGDTSNNSLHSYIWTVPNDPSTEVRVRVRMDNVGTDYYDISDDNLSILPGCCGTVYCDPNTPNSTGLPAKLAGQGSDVATDNALMLHAFQLPPNQFGYPLMSDTQASTPVAGGILCLGGTIARFKSDIFNSGATGDSGLIMLDLANLPNPPGGSVMAGETWNFQMWYRDTGTSNFTNGLSVVFK